MSNIFVPPSAQGLVVTYLRVSGRGQVDGDGPDRQRDVISKFAAGHSLWILQEFFEKAVSGTVEAMDRPGFAKLLEFVDDCSANGRRNFGGPVTAIVVERMDRLARDLMVSEFLLAECRRRGIKVYAADQGALIDMAADGADPTRVLIRQILGALAQWEKAMLVSKLKVARDRVKKNTGRCEGKKPFGTRPGEQAIINLVHNFRSVLDDNGQPMEYATIVQHLNESGFRTRHGHPWALHSVKHIMSTTTPTKIIEIEED